MVNIVDVLAHCKKNYRFDLEEKSFSLDLLVAVDYILHQKLEE